MAQGVKYFFHFLSQRDKQEDSGQPPKILNRLHFLYLEVRKEKPS